MMELFLQVYSKASQVQPPPFALLCLFIESVVCPFSLPMKTLDPHKETMQDCYNVAVSDGLPLPAGHPTRQHVTNNKSAFYVLVAAHSSVCKHMVPESFMS